MTRTPISGRALPGLLRWSPHRPRRLVACAAAGGAPRRRPAPGGASTGRLTGSRPATTRSSRNESIPKQDHAVDRRNMTAVDRRSRTGRVSAGLTGERARIAYAHYSQRHSGAGRARRGGTPASSSGRQMPVATGEGIRLARLFDGGSNAVVAAIDHGLYNGPRPGFEDLAAIVDRLKGADAILISPGMAGHVAPVFSRRGAPAMMVRLNWGTQYATQWGYHESRSVPMISAAGAVALGADVVLVGMSIKTGSGGRSTPRTSSHGRPVRRREASGRRADRRRGLPGRPRGRLAGGAPRGHLDRLPDRRRARASTWSRRSTRASASREIVRSTPVPILALGAKKLPRELDAPRAGRDRRAGWRPGRGLRPQPGPGAQPGALPARRSGRS